MNFQLKILKTIYRFILLFGCLVYGPILKAQDYCTAPPRQIHTTIAAPNVLSMQPHAITASTDGGFWATGTIATAADKLDFMVAKFSDSGKLLMLKRLGTSGDETSYPVGLAATASGGCVIAGRSHEPTIGAGLAAIAYINADGTLKWWRRTTSKGNYGRYDAFRNVLVRKNGTVFGTGSSHQWNYNSQLLLAALDSNGNEIFRNSYRYQSQTHMDASAELGSGYVVAGHDGSAPVILTVSSSGEVDRCYGYTSSDYCPITSVTVSPSGKLYVTGGYMINSKYELWVACVNPSNGEFIWQKRYKLDYAFAGKIDWVNNRLLVAFQHTTGGNWSNGFAEIDSNGNPLKVKLIKFKNVSFENHLAGMNGTIASKGGWAFIGTNKATAANLSLSLINPCDTAFCSLISTSFQSINNTNIKLSSNKGTMYYDGNFDTNLSPSYRNIAFSQKDDCLDCIKPIPTKFNDTLICAADSVLFKVPDYNSKVRWFDGDTNHVRILSKSGVYTLELVNDCASYRDTFKINTFTQMNRMLPSNVEICPNASININATQAGSGVFQYLWEDGNNQPRRTISLPGLYWVKTSDACESRVDTLFVTLKKSFIPKKLVDTTICILPFQITRSLNESSFEVMWFDGDTSKVKLFDETGTFWVEVFNGCGTYLDTFEIVKSEYPERILPDSAVLCRGNLLRLTGQQKLAGNFQYYWNTGNTTAANVLSFQPLVWLRTTNICGSRIDTVIIRSALCDCEICIPDAFTPVNLDGLNDGFKPRLDCKYLDCKVKDSYMRIYNRWGEKIHDAPVTVAWNGMYQGEFVPQGTYIYEIFIIFDDYVSGNRIFSKSGTVTVLPGNK